MPPANRNKTAGLVGTVDSLTSQPFVGWIRLYNLTFIVGLAMSFVIFCALNYFFPPIGLGEEAPFVDEVLSGVEHEGSKSGSEKLDEESGKHAAMATVSV